ncbi:MAG: 30S ribosomal protein S17 [Candidatus Sumerlaeia bacterium]|nr:30S ribosomal protein S17 [Candidatus Sumerlaeia bacterium]
MAETTVDTAGNKDLKPQPKRIAGKVVSDKMEKTIVIEVERLVKHPLYKKYIRRKKKFHVHDEQNTANIGDLVEAAEVTRPLSKLKRWRLVRVTERAK